MFWFLSFGKLTKCELKVERKQLPRKKNNLLLRGLMFSRIGLPMWKLSEQASDLTKHIYLRRKKKLFFFFSLCIPQTPALTTPPPPPPSLPKKKSLVKSRWHLSLIYMHFIYRLKVMLCEINWSFWLWFCYKESIFQPISCFYVALWVLTALYFK